MSRLPISVRLPVLSSASLAALLALLGLVVYHQLGAGLRAGLDQQLFDLAGVLPPRLDEASLDGPDDDDELAGVELSERLVQIVDGRGRVVGVSDNLGADPPLLDPASLEQVRGGTTVLRTVSEDEDPDERLRVLGVPYGAPGSVVILAAELDEVDDAQQALLGIYGPISVVGSAFLTRHRLQEASQLAELVGDLLLLARADAGHLDGHRPLDLDELVRVTARFGALATRRGVLLTSTGAAVVRGDLSGLERVVGNLVDNALRHTPERAVVSIEIRPAPGGVEVVVSDTGPGVPAERLHSLFDRFSRLDSARQEPGGAGLGLAIVAAVAAAHPGTVTRCAAADRCGLRRRWRERAGR